MDPNAFTVPFQATKSLRREVYKSIDPKNPELKATGKTILITGATGGLGGEVARAWATAGAKGIVLVGRKKELLEEPAQAVKSISSSTQVLALTADLTSESDVEALFKQATEAFGTIDVVVHAAGSMVGGPVGDLPPNEWFKDFEVNVKGSYILAHYYLKAVQSGTLIILGTLGSSFTIPGMSAYSGSKMALLKLAEYLDAEKPNLRVFTVHPGIVAATETNRGMVVESLTPFAIDKGIQTGGLSLYLAQPKADYLKGSFISVNWDVDELEAHKSEITEKQLLKLGFLKAQLGPEGHPWSA
ncbi:NAD(P)-binding protein [Delitschia confertaspora ATCC 74209]|uniref:NAD(P)-binding protein n=1 Tax=Delitschia confertaspora ATCC 74209 TaxID=1513339 RepID=A0A9P4MU52_9PLEO|nr:NAD(P)-binding protein [Delitschia confertaspora ATCC 74209]